MLNIRLLRSFAAWLFVLIGSIPLAAQTAPPGQGDVVAPASELSVYLLTMGQGDMVWEKFGHNALWIRDPVRGTDWVYNYGVFDFRSPGYWGRFVKGTWIYQIDAADIYQTIAQYQYLNRTLVAQELNLSAEQKAELQAFLEWNLRPENREYRYDYFRDNCSTRIRDALDRVLDGQLRAASKDVPTETTYRWHSRRLIADDELAYAGMNAGLGPRADQTISAYEEMFLPEKVQKWVRQIRVASPEGGYQPLVRSEQVLYRAVARAEERTAPPAWIPNFLAVGLLMGGLLALLGGTVARSALGRFAFSAIAALWALLAGTGGLILLGLWGLTDHEIAYRNENLLHFDPLALGLVLLVPAAAFGARWAKGPAAWLAGAVAGISALGFLIQALPGLDQVNGEVIALTLPVHLGLAWAVHRIGKREQVTGNRPRKHPAVPTPLSPVS